MWTNNYFKHYEESSKILPIHNVSSKTTPSSLPLLPPSVTHPPEQTKGGWLVSQKVALNHLPLPQSSFLFLWGLIWLTEHHAPTYNDHQELTFLVQRFQAKVDNAATNLPAKLWKQTRSISKDTVLPNPTVADYQSVFTSAFRLTCATL